MDAQIKEALTRAREVLRGLSFKDVAITSALEAIARTLDTERAPNGQAPAQPAPAAQADAASFKDAIITGTGITKDGIRFDPWSIYPNDNLLSIVRKIRACEGEAAALLVFETALKQHEPQPAPAVPTARVDAADSDTLLDLLADIDKHMRAEWDAGRLPASCWPTEFTQRIDAAHAQQKGGAK